MKLVTWNVNGLRAILKKTFKEDIEKINPDILCLQETKIQEWNSLFDINGYKSFSFSSTVKKGYSGVAIYTKNTPINIINGLGIKNFDEEGRTLTLEFENFYIVNSYTPNSRENLVRIDYRMEYDIALLEHIKKLSLKKTVYVCGDLNVAHNEIDLKNPQSNHFNPGFSDQERNSFTNILNNGFVDIYRKFYPNEKDAYTWWSYRFSARSKNIGWRIDYFLVDNKSEKEVKNIKILNEIMGSDHCPVMIEI